LLREQPAQQLYQRVEARFNHGAARRASRMTTAYGVMPFIVKIYIDGGRTWGPPALEAPP
jgi:hypothetical protein